MDKPQCLLPSMGATCQEQTILSLSSIVVKPCAVRACLLDEGRLGIKKDAIEKTKKPCQNTVEIK